MGRVHFHVRRVEGERVRGGARVGMDNPESRPQPSGLTADSHFATAFSSAAKKDDDWWSKAEQHTAELITSIQPNRSSEERRKAIANFVEHLIKGCLDYPVQVETYGSGPLKTYLPDGDIDHTILSVHTDLKETWAKDVEKALKRAEDDSDNFEFRVKEVQYIDANVKIIKCRVENISVDISFNQPDGLYTFFFLEEMDRYIGQNHLFKRSIILVKAWCYYESRILGAHHGLISTYALETLVLYIIHVFHASLRGPLEVLYTFLVYFSNFDWDKYCVSLWGPLPLDDIEKTGISVGIAESPRSDGGTLLLSKELLEGCIKKYSGVSPGQDSNQGQRFNIKCFNVVEPISNTDNLGRSVNVGSFKRIRSAFGLGARTLGEVLECSQEQINDKLKSFFSCTFKSLERYRSGRRPDTPSVRQEKIRATEANLAQPISGNLNVVNSEGQWRQVGGKGRYTNAEGDIARAQMKGSNPYTAPEHFERSMPVNRRSSEDHEHANQTIFRSFLAGGYQSRASSQDSPRREPSRGDLVGQGGASPNRNVSDPNLALSNHDLGRPPGPSGDFKTNSSHGNFNLKIPSGDENDTSSSGRKIAPAEQRKGQWLTQQRVYTSPGDIPHQGSSQDSGSQRSLSSSKYKPPWRQLHPHGYSGQMHLPVCSAMPVPASSLSGPPSASSVHATHQSSSSGESFPSRTNSYMSVQEPRISPSALPATSSLMVSDVPSGEGATSHSAGFSLHAEEQREHWRSPLEDQKQLLHGASVISNASPGRSFPIASTSISEICPSPLSAPSPVLSELVLGKSKPTRGGPSPPFEIGDFPQAYGPPIGESLSRLSMSDDRPGEASSQLKGADYSVLATRNRENRPHSSDVKASDGMRAKVTNGTEQLSRSQSSSDECELEVVRSVDGHAAELRRHWLSQPSLQETSVGGMQGASLHVPSFSSPPHSYQEMLATSLPSYHNSSALLSGTLEPAVTIPGQSPLVSTHQAGAGAELIPSFTLERQVLPISVGVPGGPSGPLQPIIEHGSVSTGPSFRNLPMETASLHVALPPPVYYGSSLHRPAYSPTYPPYVMPTGTDGVIRGDSMGDLHSNGSMDFGTNILGSQALQDSRARTNPQVGISVAERPKGAGAVLSPSNNMETLHFERNSEEDILFGDSKDQKEIFLQMFCIRSSNPSFGTALPQGPQVGDGLARHHGNLNSYVGPPPGIAGPSYSSFGRVPDGMQPQRGFPIIGNEDTLPKSRAGMGYLPPPRPTHVNRERSGPGGRGGNQHGWYGHQDRNNVEESYQSHAPRDRSGGQGQGRAQMVKNPASDQDWESTSPRQQTMEEGAQPPVSSLPPPGLHISSSNGYPGAGTNAPRVIMQQFVSDANTEFPPELEFGSLGPFQPG